MLFLAAFLKLLHWFIYEMSQMMLIVLIEHSKKEWFSQMIYLIHFYLLFIFIYFMFIFYFLSISFVILYFILSVFIILFYV